MTELSQKKCKPCEGGVPTLTQEESQKLLSEIIGWELNTNPDYISKTFTFNNFKEAISFVNNVAEIAEREGHHPDIIIKKYKNVKISLTTNAINGLSENDFIVASKIDNLSN